MPALRWRWTCGLDGAAWRGDGEARCQKLLNVAFTRHDAEAGKPLPYSYTIAHDLYQILFGPFEKLLTGKCLLIVPSGALTSLPFHVLITATPAAALASGDADDRAAAWLARIHALATLPSVASLKALRRIEKSAAPNPYMAFGNPLLTGRFGTDRRAFDRQACPELSQPLSERVATLFEAIMPATLFARGQASDEDDGLLMASEVAQLTLNADWVIMSACNTATGEKQDAEALLGLARAFFYAGARALLVSHWYVDSQSSVALTTTAIADMRADHKLGRAEALQHSMLALIDRGGRWAHPSNWAPFVVVGEGAAAR